ncbi:MAG: CPXCG motif-containing cysteine-rich protein, partial [Candidatus Marinimicrobia bacterium]|nr:CPXCG motif-containing cysteine-rich protein [Candidatus Neomarinimicrobiota bacterium]
MEDVVEIYCPYCGQPNEIYIDYSAGPRQTYYEDCQICCRPWQVDIRIQNDFP